MSASPPDTFLDCEPDTKIYFDTPGRVHFPALIGSPGRRFKPVSHHVNNTMKEREMRNRLGTRKLLLRAILTTLITIIVFIIATLPVDDTSLKAWRWVGAAIWCLSSGIGWVRFAISLRKQRK